MQTGINRQGLLRSLAEIDVRALDSHAIRAQLRDYPELLRKKDRDGNTLLHLAAEAAHEPLVRMLVEAGADALARNVAGETPFDVAGNAGVRVLVSGWGYIGKPPFNGIPSYYRSR